ncbi:hypothetical protein Trydic_g16756 [Trypoxylus dichotomus]
MSDNNFDQRCVIRLCFRHGHSMEQSFVNLEEIYGANIFSRVQVFNSVEEFLEGRGSLEDERCSRRPSTTRSDENVESDIVD